MTVPEAAKLIGCIPRHVRTLCQQGKLKARKVPSPRHSAGFYYDVSLTAAKRYRDRVQRSGFPRGAKRDDDHKLIL